MFKKIALICTGNICRSPMAEGLLRQRLSADYQIFSAGTHALIGRPAEPGAIEAMADLGIDISAHRARQASTPYLSGADLILVAEQVHLDWLTRASPQLRGRIHKLGKWNKDMDIDDPYMQPKSAFVSVLEDIDQSIAGWLPHLG